MIQSNWYRICGLHIQNEGEMAAVWLAHDRDTDTVHLYDACLFKREVLAVIAEGLNARAKWIPIAWSAEAKDLADSLIQRGCNMMPEGVKESDTMIEIVSRDIAERQRTGRFKVDKRLKEWEDEFKTFYRQEAKVPKEGYPLMSATRLVMNPEVLPYAKRQSTSRRHSVNYPKVATI